MDEFSYEIKVPKERLAVLIGTDGETKKKIAEETESTINVDSKEGGVIVSGQDAIKLLSAREIIKAIARGVNPNIAFLLLKADYLLDIISINDYTNKSKNSLVRVKGRIIGSQGKTRKLIEELTETHVCAYGKTVTIIGTSERASIARRAIVSLLTGSPHASVYKWLEKKCKELKNSENMFKEDFDSYVRDDAMNPKTD